MGRILIADDHDSLRRGLAQSVAEAGHDVEEAPNGNAAIEKLQVSLTKSSSKREHKPKSGEGEKKTARVPRRRTRHEKAAEVRNEIGL